MKYPVATSIVALMAVAGCATPEPKFPSDLSYNYVAPERGKPAPVAQPTAIPLIAGLTPGSGGPIAKERIDKPKTSREAVRRANKNSETNPLDCDFQNSVMVCPYQMGRKYNVYVKPSDLESGKAATPTLFLGQVGETLKNFGFEDYTWFQVGDPDKQVEEVGVDLTAKYGGGPGSQFAIPVRGWKNGECTDFWIMTDRRLYQTHICVQQDNNQVVAWHYPRGPEQVDNVYTIQTPQEAAGGASIDPARMRRYDVSGSPEWLPDRWEAFHDGEVLHLIPPKELASRPVPFIRRDGLEGQTRWDLAADGHYLIYGRPSEVFMHEGNEENRIIFKVRG